MSSLDRASIEAGANYAYLSATSGSTRPVALVPTKRISSVLDFPDELPTSGVIRGAAVSYA
jgi:hypothetical protein